MFRPLIVCTAAAAALGLGFTAARLLSMENEIGRIAPGMSADMIAVDGDPLGDVTTLEHVRWVMARGRIAD